MTSFRELIIGLDQMGFYDVALPFIVIFALTFALLEKVKIFNNRSINGVLALAMGFLFLQNDYLLQMFHRIVPNVAFILLAVILGLLLIGIFAGKSVQFRGLFLTIAFFFAIASIITAASYDRLGRGYESWWQWFVDLDPGSRMTIFGILIVGLILWLIFKQPPAQGQTRNSLTNWIKGNLGLDDDSGKPGE